MSLAIRTPQDYIQGKSSISSGVKLTLTKSADAVDGIGDRTDVLVVFPAHLRRQGGGGEIGALTSIRSEKPPQAGNSAALDLLQRRRPLRRSSLLPSRRRPDSGRRLDRSSRSASGSGGGRRLGEESRPD